MVRGGDVVKVQNRYTCDMCGKAIHPNRINVFEMCRLDHTTGIREVVSEFHMCDRCADATVGYLRSGR